MKPASKFPTRQATLALVAALVMNTAAHAERSASEVSQASMVPVAISVALPVVLVGGVGSIVVTSVQASAEGTVWVVESVADGVKGSVCFAGRAVEAAGIAVGTVLVATAVSTGTVLSNAGRVVAFIPNEIGRSLSYNERVSR